MNFMKERVIFGATSATAECVARNWAAKGDYLTIVGRNSTKLGKLAKDLQSKGAAKVDVAVLDFQDPKTVWKETEEILKDKARVDTLLVAHALKEIGLEEKPTIEKIENLWRVNLTSTCAILLAAKPHFLRNQYGTMAAISCFSSQVSLPGNAIHAAAKGGLDAFIASLRQDLAPYNVRVCSIVPGPVKNAEQVAKQITDQIDSKAVIYAPSAIKWWTLGFRFFPGFVRRRLTL